MASGTRFMRGLAFGVPVSMVVWAAALAPILIIN